MKTKGNTGNMMVTIQYTDLIIELFNDSAFAETPDSPTFYEKVYKSDKNNEYEPISQHAIVVYCGSQKVTSAILLAAAGATSVSKDAVVIDEGSIITRCCSTLFSMTLPDLELNWMTDVDFATCFSLQIYRDTYISHGELCISRIDRNGRILWIFEGEDIFVCLDNGRNFAMYEDYIALTDFSGNQYKIDYNGNTIDFQKSNHKN